MDNNLICHYCESNMNLYKNQPVVLPCKNLICMNCLKKDQEPQDFKKKLQCIDCNKTHIIDIQQEEKQIEINNLFLNQKKFMCAKHQNEDIKFYCQQDFQYICSECIHDHLDHYNQVQKTSQTDIVDRAKKFKSKTLELKLKIDQIEHVLDQIIKNQNNVNSQQISKCFNDSDDILFGQLICNVGQKRQKIENNFIGKQNQSILKQIIQRDIMVEEKILQLLTDYKDIQLLYKGSKDGFLCKVFHEKCDDQGATLAIIQSEHDKIFGGYTDIPWKNEDGVCKEGEGKSFLFSLRDDGNIIKLKCIDKQRETYHKSSYMVSFDGGFSIEDECNINEDSYSDLAYSKVYDVPQGFIRDSKEIKQFLAGAKQFKVKEIEVYKIV